MMVKGTHDVREQPKVSELSTAPITDPHVTHFAVEEPIHQQQNGQTDSVGEWHEHCPNHDDETAQDLIEILSPIELPAIAKRAPGEVPRP